MEPEKVAVVHNKIRDYRIPVFEFFASEFDTDFYVFEEEAEEYPFDVKFAGSKEILLGIIDGDYDVVILPDYVFKQSWVGAVAAVVSGTAIVCWTEVWDMPHTGTPKKVIKVLLAFVMGTLADSFVVPGKRSEEFLVSNTLTDRDDVFRAPNAHNFPEASDDPPDFGINTDCKKVLYIGQLIERKRVQDIIRAVESIEIDSEIKLLIGGTGDTAYREYLDRIADERTVRFLGWVDDEDVPGLYEYADVYVLPSLQDPYPLTVIEAMSYGTPVVISEGVGEAGDVVRHGETGEIVPTKSPESIATSLERILDDREYRSYLAEQGQEIVEDRVTYEEMNLQFRHAIKRAEGN